jgi:hypothetical protein
MEQKKRKYKSITDVEVCWIETGEPNEDEKLLFKKLDYGKWTMLHAWEKDVDENDNNFLFIRALCLKFDLMENSIIHEAETFFCWVAQKKMTTNEKELIKNYYTHSRMSFNDKL